MTAEQTTSLSRSNLLRLETSALLSESTLHIHPPSSLSHGTTVGEERAHDEVKWSPAVRRYIHVVNDVVTSLDGTTLSPDVCKVEDGYRIPLCSDKAQKHCAGDKWEFDTPKTLSLVPVGSFGCAAGLTNRHGNGNCVPVLDVGVFMEGFLGGKDYLNGRYADKRNILAIHIAKTLSQKKHRSKIGAVHITPLFGDARKVALLLTPPPDLEVEADKSSKKKRKKSKINKAKVRFRIRLVFGMQKGINNSSSNLDDSDDEEEQWTCWVPRSRLFPDRNNNRMLADSTASATPHYINDMAEDLHYLSTTKLISSTIAFITDNNVTTTSAFQETLTLLKVWALQRGFLRGHDTFTTTTLAVLLVYMYRTKVIGKRMACIQAFTAFMKFWSDTDWLGEDTLSSDMARGGMTKVEAVKQHKIKMKAAHVIPLEGKNEVQTINSCEQARLYLNDVHDNNTQTLLECYKAHYTSSSSSFTISNSHHDAPILLDPSMTINYLARLSPSFVKESRGEALAALKCIHGEDGAFRRLFLETRRFWSRFDAYLRVPLDKVPKLGKVKFKSGKGGSNSNGRVWGDDVDDLGYNESVCRGVVQVLSVALGDRVTAVRALTCGNGDIGSDTESTDEDVATRCIVDSDQYLGVPIRGNTKGHWYSANLERVAEPPVVSINKKDQCIVVGLRIDPNASRRVVDRGPPAEDVEGSDSFVSLWGEQFAQIRRFQDGAIVRAVVWNNPSSDPSQQGTVQYSGGDRLIGGIVEKVANYIIGMHFGREKTGSSNKQVAFELRNMASFVDGCLSPEKPSPFSDAMLLHKNVLLAFESLSDFLRRNSATTIDSAAGKGKKMSKLGIPLSIDEVEALSPCLRYSSLFPPTPHPFLGGANVTPGGKVSGAVDGEPILIQIRFGGSSKWPTSLNAMGAAKCAMLVQLAEGIQKMKDERDKSEDMEAFDGPMDNALNHLTIGYRGYSWRIIVRADQELKMLKGLKNPTNEAKRMKEGLINRHVRGSMHHSLIHSVHTRHPSASAVVRLASRWIASHMLSDMIPHEAIELIVARIYTDSSDNAKPMVDAPPSTLMAGFLRFLQLLYTHDWAKEPLIVDPQQHISNQDPALIHSQFDAIRGPEHNKGPPMYIISPVDYDGVEEMAGSKVTGIEEESPQGIVAENSTKLWAPTITATYPEKVVLTRASALAKCSHDYLISCIINGDGDSNKWVAAFQESSSSLTSYSALLRVDTSFITDPGCSSTSAQRQQALLKEDGTAQTPFERSIQRRADGPKQFRKKHYKNLILDKDTLLEWNPVKSLVASLRRKYHHYAVFFYNEYCPDIIAMLWRPKAFSPESFSAMVSEFKNPVVLNSWQEDTLVVTNTDDLVYEIGYAARDVVTDIKVIDEKNQKDTSKHEVKRHKACHEQEEEEGES